jgi:hypothetical protein
VVVTSVREPTTFVFGEMLRPTLLPYNLTRPESCPSWKTEATKYEHNIRPTTDRRDRNTIIYDLLLLSSLLLFNVGCYRRRYTEMSISSPWVAKIFNRILLYITPHIRLMFEWKSLNLNIPILYCGHDFCVAIGPNTKFIKIAKVRFFMPISP